MATETSPKRRELHFNTVGDALEEAERVAAAEREGRLDRCGNWTAGQSLGHLAIWADFAFDGYPDVVRPPLPIRIVLRLMKNRVLTKGMMAGVKMGRVPGGTVGTEILSPDEGLTRYRAAMERLRNTAPTIVNPVFGPLTHEQWIQLNLRHAELHLSFLLPRS